MLKGKILATYFPDRYLNIFDNEHLAHFLRILNIGTKDQEKLDPVYKREALRLYKENDPDMNSWSLDVFGTFLYRHFPPPKKRDRQRSR